MNTALAIFPKSVTEAQQLAETLCRTSLVPDTLRNKPGDTLLVLLSGAELGIPPTAALRSIYVVKGRPCLSAQMMLGLARSLPSCEYITEGKCDATSATFEARRKGDPRPTIRTWTIEQARAAGLAGSQTWKAYTAEMLRARCASSLVRSVFPEAILGLYTPDEAEHPPTEVAPVEAVRVEVEPPRALPERQPGEDDRAVPAEEELGLSAAKSMQRQLAAELDAQEVADPRLRPGFDPGDASDAAEAEAHDLLGEASTPADLAPRSGLVDRVAALAGRMTREAGSRTRAYYLKRKAEVSKATEPGPATAKVGLSTRLLNDPEEP